MAIPASTTIPQTTSKFVQDPEVTSLLTAVRALLGAFVSDILSVANGGTSFATYAQGDLLYASAANVLSRLGKGTSGQLLQQGATIPAWAGDTAWTAVSGGVGFANSWVNSGGSEQDAAFFKDACGFVHLRGVVKNGTVGTTIFTLPSGYRPTGRVRFGDPNDSAASGRVESTGTVIHDTGVNGFFALNGCSFNTV